MRLIQNMCTIAEYPAAGSAAAAECCLGAAGRRLVKIAVVGASGVGKTGESASSRSPRAAGVTLKAAWGEVGAQRTPHPPAKESQPPRGPEPP